MIKEWWEDDHVREDIESISDSDWQHNQPTPESDPRCVPFEIYIPLHYLNIDWTDEQIEIMRPVAETFALLHSAHAVHWRNYLAHAAAVLDNSGGPNGAVRDASWMVDRQHETPAVKTAYEDWQTLKNLCR